MPALGITWYLLFLFTTISIKRLLVPWGMLGSLAPLPGTWERELNDFFDLSPGKYLPALLPVGVSFTLFLVGLFRATGNVRVWLPLAFTVLNFAFLSLWLPPLVAVGFLTHLLLPQPIELGYHRNWPLILTSVGCLVILFFSHWKAPTFLRSKICNKNEDLRFQS